MYMCIIYYLKQILTQLHLCSCVSGKLTNIVIIYNDFIQDFFINLKLHLCDMKKRNSINIKLIIIEYIKMGFFYYIMCTSYFFKQFYI
jgi:hypothetical protein